MKAKTAKTPSLTGRDPISQLYRAVARYVKAKGGSVVVIGGIQVQQQFSDHKSNFSIAIKCAGTLPSFAEVTHAAK